MSLGNGDPVALSWELLGTCNWLGAPEGPGGYGGRWPICVLGSPWLAAGRPLNMCASSPPTPIDFDRGPTKIWDSGLLTVTQWGKPRQVAPNTESQVCPLELSSFQTNAFPTILPCPSPSFMPPPPACPCASQSPFIPSPHCQGRSPLANLGKQDLQQAFVWPCLLFKVWIKNLSYLK